MAGSGHVKVPKELNKYLIPSESIIFILHRHWIVLLEPVLTVVAGLVVVIAIADRTSGSVVSAAIALWAGLVLRLAFRVADHHQEYFLATGSRLMLVHGIVTRKVDIMPMGKVTDMRYDRSLLGQVLGYGVFILESAGQDQALSRINFIPDPDHHYQLISAVIFSPSPGRVANQLNPSARGSQLPISEPDRAWWRRS